MSTTRRVVTAFSWESNAARRWIEIPDTAAFDIYKNHLGEPTLRIEDTETVRKHTLSPLAYLSIPGEDTVHYDFTDRLSTISATAPEDLIVALDLELNNHNWLIEPYRKFKLQYVHYNSPCQTQLDDYLKNRKNIVYDIYNSEYKDSSELHVMYGCFGLELIELLRRIDASKDYWDVGTIGRLIIEPNTLDSHDCSRALIKFICTCMPDIKPVPVRGVLPYNLDPAIRYITTDIGFPAIAIMTNDRNRHLQIGDAINETISRSVGRRT